MTEVVVDTRLGFGKVLGLRQPLEVEEFRDRPQVGESTGQGGGADAIKSVSQLETARQSVDGDLDSCHCCRISLRLGLEVVTGSGVAIVRSGC